MRPHSSSSSSSSNYSDDHPGDNPQANPLRNRPVGAPKDWGIDLTTIKARRRQATYRGKLAARHNRRYKARSFEIGAVVTVKIPKKERATSIDDRRMYAKMVGKKRNTYQLQTKYGILARWYHTRDLAPVAPALAKHLDIPNIQREVTLRQAAIHTTSATFTRISCRCRGSCDNRRCSCKKHSVGCSIHCHQGTRDCGKLIQGPEFSDYALARRES